MNTGLKDQVVLITGASGGIGSSCARRMSKEGARVVLHGHRNMERAKNLADGLETDTYIQQADLREEEEVKDMFRKVDENFGRPDVLVANAGVWPHEETPIHRMSLKRWEDTIETDQTSVFLCAREFFRLLDRDRPEYASLVIIGSTAAVFGEENHSDYSAAKAAITYGLTKSLKNEITRLVRRGRVNAVCPGWTKTRMSESGLADREKVTKVLQTRSIKRVGRPSEIADTVAFLASDKLASHISGETLTVSGGMEGRILHLAEEVDPDSA